MFDENFVVMILEKTEKFSKRHEQLCELLYSPEVVADKRWYARVVAENRTLEVLASGHNKLQMTLSQLKKCEKELSLCKDINMQELLENEIEVLQNEANEITLSLRKSMVLSQDNLGNVALCEIFIENSEEDCAAKTLLDMYQNYAKSHEFGCKLTVKTKFKYVLEIRGEKVLSLLQSENGKHKFINASGTFKEVFATVSVIPPKEKVNIEILDKDIKIDVFHASGAGGQNINKVETAIRATHKASGIVVTCQDERSQFKNKERAIYTLKEKVANFYQQEQDKLYDSELKKLAKNALKENESRIYNFNKDECTDLKTGLKVSLREVLQGNIDCFLDLALF